MIPLHCLYRMYQACSLVSGEEYEGKDDSISIYHLDALYGY
jgi:hypothetical protein